MKNTIVKFGLLSAATSAALMFASVPFLNFKYGAYIGYSSMVVAFLFVYFGVRSYRDNVQAGTVTFGRALGVGLLITLISCIGYVIAWEILYFNFMPDFLDKYAAYSIDHLRSTGATEAVIAKATKEMADFKVMYSNPLINIAFTILEPLPVGVLVSLVSAAVLRKK